ncbi:pollen-specific leucine-rich repeat extensin-like protein 1 isoform X2 [Anarrhichthys ocellatus]|nr:pollen-specific leucine-rich repeat extensin-like protein 1 isoform X2 [Anarrhichthys ocellatus]
MPVLESSAIPESGTASVRARPTVNHHTSSFDSFQGFAVPTPKVPLLPPVNGPKINGSVGGNHLSNESVISVPGISVPPPPAMAPPPPPGTFIPPPLDFMGDLNSLNVAPFPSLSMPNPKPTSLAPFMEGEDLTFKKPPPMAPPKPPPTYSNGSASPVPSPPPATVPERPMFSPPLPPSERQHKTNKKPPPKPIRLSSISNLDSPPGTPAPPPPVQTNTLSSFNPQNTAKLYYVPQTSILSGYEEQDKRQKQMLLLEDSAAVKSAPVLVQVDGKAPKVATPYKPAPKDVQELKENLQIPQPSQSPPPEPNKEVKKEIASVQPEIDKPLQTPHQLLKLNNTRVNSEPINDQFVESPSQICKFSPLIDRKLRNLKGSETHGARDGPTASPLALLMAAKERDKHKSSHPLSRENSRKTIEQPSASIHPSDTNPNSFVVTPKSSSSSTLTSLERIQESLKSTSPAVHTQTVQTPAKSSSPALVEDPMPSTRSALSRTAASPSATHLVEQRLNAVQSPSNSQNTQPEELSMPLLPPPPEFDDFDDFDENMEPPPSVPPPDPPKKKAPTPNVIPLPPSHVPPPPPKLPPAAPKLPPPDIDVKPKFQPLQKPKAAPAPLPSTLSPSQSTLLSILQKKMLEMDHKMAPVNEAESTSDDWGSPLSDEDNKVPVVQRAARQSKNNPVVNKAATLNMQELESKLVSKYQETSSVKVPASNGTQSKHQHGMTFTVRPGTKQPITLVRKGDP